MIASILVGIFGDTIYDIIKKALKSIFIDKDDDLSERVYQTIEKASNDFFIHYKNEFGKPESSFLARQENINIIIKGMFYSNNNELIDSISPKGFDGAKDASIEALHYFIDKLNSFMMEDFRLNQILTEKKHISENSQMLKMLNSMLSNKSVPNEESKDQFKGWSITDGNGNKEPLVEGKYYICNFPNGIKIKTMFKNNLIYVEMTDLHQQTAYYEMDINGNVMDWKFPHDYKEYKVIIPDGQLIHKNILPLTHGFHREIIKLKWDKTLDVIYNERGEIVQILSFQGGWEIKHFERQIVPKY